MPSARQGSAEPAVVTVLLLWWCRGRGSGGTRLLGIRDASRAANLVSGMRRSLPRVDELYVRCPVGHTPIQRRLQLSVWFPAVCHGLRGPALGCDHRGDDRAGRACPSPARPGRALTPISACRQCRRLRVGYPVARRTPTSASEYKLSTSVAEGTTHAAWAGMHCPSMRCAR